MRRQDLEAMDFEELWLLHEELTKILAEKITVEKRELEKRLAQLNQPDQFGEARPHGVALRQSVEDLRAMQGAPLLTASRIGQAVGDEEEGMFKRRNFY